MIETLAWLLAMVILVSVMTLIIIGLTCDFDEDQE